MESRKTTTQPANSVNVGAALINELLVKYKADFHSIVDFDGSKDSVVALDFTGQNDELGIEITTNTNLFCEYINRKLQSNNAKFGIGGYFENRTVYARSKYFDGSDEEPRRLHLGVDIWGEAMTPVYAFMDATVHSYAFNNNYGDYGATIILQHSIENTVFYSLYGHLSLQNLGNLYIGKQIKKGEHFCDFGSPAENGDWPPHLHLQLIVDMDGREGDYPGVVKLSEKEKWLTKIPDANLVLDFY